MITSYTMETEMGIECSAYCKHKDDGLHMRCLPVKCEVMKRKEDPHSVKHPNSVKHSLTPPLVFIIVPGLVA